MQMRSCVQQPDHHSPAAMHEEHGSWQAVIVVYDELYVPHSLIPLVRYGGMLGALSVLRVFYLVHNVRNIADVDIQPGRVLHKQIPKDLSDGYDSAAV